MDKSQTPLLDPFRNDWRLARPTIDLLESIRGVYNDINRPQAMAKKESISIGEATVVCQRITAALGGIIDAITKAAGNEPFSEEEIKT